MTEGERLSAIERLNQASAEQAHRRAAETRTETVDLAYEAVRLRLDQDKDTMDDLEARDYPDSETVGLFVLEDMLVAPATGNVPQRVFGILLVEEDPEPASDVSDEFDDTTVDGVRDDIAQNLDSDTVFKRLKIYVPVPEDVQIEDFLMPPASVIDEVYLEYSLGDAAPLRYVVNRQWMHEYMSAADAQGSVPLDFNEFVRRTGTTVDEGVVTVVEAFRNIINMHAVTQRQITIGQPGSRDT